MKDYPPILHDIVYHSLWDGKVLDQGSNPPNWWGQVALANKLEDLLLQDCLLVWFERRLALP